MFARSPTSLFVALLLVLLVPFGLRAQELSPEDQSVVFFERAREAFELGEFERANLLLREAIELNDVSPLHYNLARSLQELGQWSEARAEYHTFLRMAPNTPERTRVEARIRLLDERIEAAQALAAPSEETLEETPEDTSSESRGAAPLSGDASVSPVAWVTLGTGLVALAGGATSGLLSRRSIDAAREAANHEVAERNVRAAERQSIAANVLFGVGGTLALGGLVWVLVSRRKVRAAQTNVDIGFGSVQLRHAF